MKCINGYFFSKDFRDKYFTKALFRRKVRDTKTGEVIGDDFLDTLGDNETAADGITLNVYSQNNNDLVAVCNAYCAQVVPDAADVFIHNEVFGSLVQCGTVYASQQLARKKAAPMRFDPPTERVLVIYHIEVAWNKCRKGVATNILDYLFKTLAPDYVVTACLPTYRRKVPQGPVVLDSVLANTNIVAFDEFMRKLGFVPSGTTNIMDNGIPVRVPLYVINNDQR